MKLFVSSKGSQVLHDYQPILERGGGQENNNNKQQQQQHAFGSEQPHNKHRSSSTSKTAAMTFSSITESWSDDINAAISNTLDYFGQQGSTASKDKTPPRPEQNRNASGKSKDAGEAASAGLESNGSGDAVVNPAETVRTRSNNNGSSFSLHPSASKFDIAHAADIVLEVHGLERDLENIELSMNQRAAKTAGKGHDKNKSSSASAADPVKTTISQQQQHADLNIKPVVHVSLPVRGGKADGPKRPPQAADSPLVSPPHSMCSQISSFSMDSSENGSRVFSLLDKSQDEDDDDDESKKSDGHSKAATTDLVSPTTSAGSYTVYTDFADDDTMAVLNAALTHVATCQFLPPEDDTRSIMGTDVNDQVTVATMTPQANYKGRFFQYMFGCSD